MRIFNGRTFPDGYVHPVTGCRPYRTTYAWGIIIIYLCITLAGGMKSGKNTSSNTEFSGSKAGSWSRIPTVMSFLKITVPLYEVSFPAIIRKSVDLPIPFLAIKATFCPLPIPKDIFSNNSCSPNRLLRLSTCK